MILIYYDEIRYI